MKTGCSFLVLVLSWSILTVHADAQEPDDGFALNRYDPSERGSDWFAGDSMDMRGNVRGGFGIVGDYGYRPLVLYQEGEDSVAVVEHQLFTYVGGTLILWNRLRLGLNFPLLVLSEGDDKTVDRKRYSTVGGVKAGDLRVGADIRLLGEYREPFSLAIGVKAHLPTGNKDAYASDGKVRVEPRIMAAGDIGVFVYAARVSFNYRALHGTLTGATFGSEIGLGASAGLRVLDKKLVIGPEFVGATIVQKSSAVFKRATTPMELLFGAKFRVGNDFIAGVGLGSGLTRGYGEPALRVLASIEWFPDVEKPKPEPVMEAPKDTDSDGIIDDQDACPNERGIKNDDPKKNGCPPPKDTDRDAIIDEQDACPDQPGEKNDDPKKNGCPPPKDTDGDAIIDEQDACPGEAGKRNDDPKKNGCPLVVVTDEQIVINERIEFDQAKDTLRPESDTILLAVLRVMQERRDITKLSVEGHTDNEGSRRRNLKLSNRRAAAVVKWLEDRGVDKKRLTSKGFGQENPIDDNATETGRQNNRRVEFKIVKK
jgi:OOP family OmpA-OmpF porin